MPACTDRLLAGLEYDLPVSCPYVHLGLARHHVTLADAGHMPPPLRRRPGEASVLDAGPGPLLGVGIRAGSPVTAATPPPEAVLALSTDGLVEARGTDAAETTAGLAQHLADTDAHDLEKLIDDLVGHTWPAGRRTDGIAVLLPHANGTRAWDGIGHAEGVPDGFQVRNPMCTWSWWVASLKNWSGALPPDRRAGPPTL
ncbi:PP2C family protein-serine/threonine phosphatase [Streptomyces sp. JNUCC 63]